MRVGDKVRVLRHRNFFGEEIPNCGIPFGTIVTIKARNDEMDGDNFEMYVVEDAGDGASWLVRSDDVEPVTEGPIRTVTRREIVPGVYGRIKVMSDGFHALNINVTKPGHCWTTEELLEASHLLAQLAEVTRD